MLLLPPTSETPSAEASRSLPSLPRLIAIVLALGALFWGVLLLLMFGAAVLIPIPFGVGYLVTAGYIARAVTYPSIVTRQVIWIVSIVVQGGWLLLAGVPELPRVNLPFVWWAFATAASMVAIATERGPGYELEATPDPTL